MNCRTQEWYDNHKNDNGARVEIYRKNNYASAEAYLFTKHLYERVPMRLVSEEVKAGRLIYDHTSGRTLIYKTPNV